MSLFYSDSEQMISFWRYHIDNVILLRSINLWNNIFRVLSTIF